MKAIIYARFSPRPNADNCESCETQIEACRAFCRKSGLVVVDVLRDDAVSGADHERLGLWQAVESLKRGYRLVVYKFDRLARDGALFYMVEAAVAKARAKIVSASGEGTIEESMTPDERLKIGILKLFAEYEREVTRYRTRTAMRWHQANGRAMSAIPPYGWRRAGKALVPVPTQQKAIESIVAMHRNGSGLREIARTLDMCGAPCNGKSWKHQTVKAILQRAGQLESP